MTSTAPINLFQGAAPAPPPFAYSIVVVEIAGHHIWVGGPASRRNKSSVLRDRIEEQRAKGWEVVRGEPRKCWTRIGSGGRFLGWAHGEGAVVRPKRMAGCVPGLAIEVAIGFPSLDAARSWSASIAASYTPAPTPQPPSATPQVTVPEAHEEGPPPMETAPPELTLEYLLSDVPLAESLG